MPKLTQKHRDRIKKEDKEILLGIDYGNKNLGIAFGRDGLVKPLKVLKAEDMPALLHEITKFIFENKVTKIVVGLPLTYEGKDTQKSKEIRNFAKQIKVYLKKPVVFVNEYRSTEEILEGSSFGIPHRGKDPVDHLSAAVILRRFYEEGIK